MRDASYYGMDNMRRQRSYMIHGTGEQASLLTIQARERPLTYVAEGEQPQPRNALGKDMR